MGRVKYYNPKQNVWRSLFTWRATIFEFVICQPEFYGYLAWNILVTTLIIALTKQGDFDDFNWDAASVMQYVMTFFATFYNDLCYVRYQELYPACVSFMDNVVFLIQEVHVNLHWPALKQHRIAIAKYLMALVYETFMTLCGGPLRESSWDQFVKKGLLTVDETKLLDSYPGGRASPVLCCWILTILRHAMFQDCMWRKNADDFDVSQQTVHIYNRHCQHVVNLQAAANRIYYVMANPIPYAYYNLMNFILLFNIMLLATFTGLYRSYLTVIPFTIALLIYMGLREVSCALADPFGKDSLDFPVPDFIRNCFDRCVSLVLAFQSAESRDWLLKQVEQVDDFEDEHLKRYCKSSLFGETDNVIRRGYAIMMKWSAESPFEDSTEESRIKEKMEISMNPDAELPPEVHNVVNPELKRKSIRRLRSLEDERVIELELKERDLEVQIHEVEVKIQMLEEADERIAQEARRQETLERIEMQEATRKKSGRNPARNSDRWSVKTSMDTATT